MRGKGGSMHLTSVEARRDGLLRNRRRAPADRGGRRLVGAVPRHETGRLCVFRRRRHQYRRLHEALNLAAVWKLPVLFVCENNLYMEYTPISAVTAVKHPAADRAASYGLERHGDRRQRRRRRIQHRARAIAKARSGGGPFARRMPDLQDTAATSRADPAKYRPKEEVEEWMKRDPITLYRNRLLGTGIAEATLAKIEAEAMAKLDRATEAAKASRRRRSSRPCPTVVLNSARRRPCPRRNQYDAARRASFPARFRRRPLPGSSVAPCAASSAHTSVMADSSAGVGDAFGRLGGPVQLRHGFGFDLRQRGFRDTGPEQPIAIKA